MRGSASDSGNCRIFASKAGSSKHPLKAVESNGFACVTGFRYDARAEGSIGLPLLVPYLFAALDAEIQLWIRRRHAESPYQPGKTIMTKAILGVIGGSGIYELPGLEDAREEAVRSPWGEPSAPLRRGTIDGLPIVFLPRHDRGHRLSPSDINYRANIDVLKRAGVTDLISLSACGSFKEELPPGTFVLVDQFIDRTYKRESSFFGKGCVAHVSMAHPVSPRLRIHLAAAAEAEGI